MNKTNVYFITILLVSLGILVSCDKDDNPLATYVGQREMSEILIEEGSFIPRITWLGGYVSTFGVNRGLHAILDSTLVWLIHSEGDNITYPVTFGQLPEGAQDLTNQYGGNTKEQLSEDNIYTFWVLKGDAWNFVSQHSNKPMLLDQNLDSGITEVLNDTIYISLFSHAQLMQALDVYVNISESTSRGKLATLYIAQSSTNNNPTVTWDIKQSGVTETSISAMGLCVGTSYSANRIVWEVWSVEIIEGQNVYGKKNVIDQPVTMGDSFPGTHVFYEYPVEGLERNRDYYFWIANKEWDGKNHGRVVTNYAYISFHTN